MFRFHASLEKSPLPVWRQLQIREDVSIIEFAHAIAALFFESPSDAIMRFDRHKFIINFLENDEPQLELLKLRDLVTAPGQRFHFEHHGDTSWSFLIEYIAKTEEPLKRALCVDGRGDMPTDQWDSIEQLSDYVSEQISRNLSSNKANRNSIEEDFRVEIDWFVPFDIGSINDRLTECC
jgi:hypothetical protein